MSRGKNAAPRATRKKTRLDALHDRIANANIKRIVETDQLQAVARDLQRQLGTALATVAIYEKFMQELEHDGNDSVKQLVGALRETIAEMRQIRRSSVSVDTREIR